MLNFEVKAFFIRFPSCEKKVANGNMGGFLLFTMLNATCRCHLIRMCVWYVIVSEPIMILCLVVLVRSSELLLSMLKYCVQ